MGHTLARGRGGVDRIAGMVKDWRDMRLIVRGRARGAVLTTGLVVWSSKPPSATDSGFC
jgi:phage host-nuclease inhibitor protein Gam